MITVTPGDVVMPDISSTNPFFARLGICYTSENNSQNNGHPTSPEQFVIERGYRSYGGGGIPTDRDKTLNLYWNKLSERYVNDQSQKEVCFDLNSANNERNLGPGGCPAHGVTSVPSGGARRRRPRKGTRSATTRASIRPPSSSRRSASTRASARTR